MAGDREGTGRGRTWVPPTSLQRGPDQLRAGEQVGPHPAPQATRVEAAGVPSPWSPAPVPRGQQELQGSGEVLAASASSGVPGVPGLVATRLLSLPLPLSVLLPPSGQDAWHCTEHSARPARVISPLQSQSLVTPANTLRPNKVKTQTGDRDVDKSF